MMDVLVLGPQLRRPVLGPALAAAGMTGPMVAITAGWQEREGELAALEGHLGQPVVDLQLYARAEHVFARDPELRAAHRERQQRLREIQDLYRRRLDHAKAAARELDQSTPVTPPLQRARLASIRALQCLDAEHLREIERVHRRFALRWRPGERPAVVEQVRELENIVTHASTVLIAGGHVAVLGSRLRLFDASRWLAGKAIAAWSAGAMALAHRVVLFHDYPAQGAGNAELFERGLGLVPQAVLLPDAERRLTLDDPARTAMLARRFAPDACYTLDEGAWLHLREGRPAAQAGVRRLQRRARAGDGVTQ
jgi:hypothetical protein